MMNNQSILKKFMAWLVIFAMFFGMTSGWNTDMGKVYAEALGSPTAANVDSWDGTASEITNGDGGVSSPYLIESAEQLAYLAQQVNDGIDYKGKYILLTVNIDLKDQQWTPIGKDEFNPFEGIFDGGEHVIYNLTIGSESQPNEQLDHAGLFGEVYEATIKNVGVENIGIYINVRQNTTNESSFAGGLIGRVKLGEGDVNTHIINCYTTGTIENSTGGTGDRVAGGLVGKFYGLEPDKPIGERGIYNSYSTADVKCWVSGGLVGATCGNYIIENCYAAGTSTTIPGSTMKGGFIGGVEVGSLGPPTYVNCYWNSSDNSQAFGWNIYSYNVAGKASEDMKSEDFLNELNSNKAAIPEAAEWRFVSGKNDGYPMLWDTGNTEGPIKYTVTFQSNGGSTVDAKNDIEENTSISEPAEPTKEGYIFAGWYKDEGLTDAWNFATDKVTKNITLYAKWEAYEKLEIDMDKDMAHGGLHSLAIGKDGKVWAWGNNGYGQLGIGNTMASYIPVTVAGIENIKSVAAGYYHSLALKTDGTLWAWGNNANGELGLGNADSSTSKNAPVQIPSLTNIKAVAAGDNHSIALKEDGTVYLWGKGDKGQLGNGSTYSFKAPMQLMVSDASNQSVPFIAKAIFAGANYSMAIREDGTLWAWGDNSYGKLGDGTWIINRLSPVQVQGLSKVVLLDGGVNFTAALKEDGTVWAWGRNNKGQLGNKTIDDSNIPVQVINDDGTAFKAISLAAGGEHTIAIKEDHTVWTWGSNSMVTGGSGPVGALGDYSMDPYKTTPVQVLHNDRRILEKAVSVSAGEAYSTAITKDGKLWAWGYNPNRTRFGNYDVNNFTNFALLVGEEYGKQAKEYNVRFYAMGGSDIAAAEDVPADSKLQAPQDPEKLGYKFGGWYKDYQCKNQWDFDVDTVNGNIMLYAKWIGENHPLPISKNLISAGETHTLAVKADRTSWAWGSNLNSQLGLIGDINSINQLSPANMAEDGEGNEFRPAAIKAGSGHSIALMEDGTVWAWGGNEEHQIGVTTLTARKSAKPIQIKDIYGYPLTDVISISAGYSHNLALKKDGTVWAWGAGGGLRTLGFVADTLLRSARAVQVQGLSNIKQISAGYGHNAVLDADGNVWTWGINDYGQIGKEDVSFTSEPIEIELGYKVKAVSAGFRHTAALLENGEIWTWGWSYSEALGRVGDGKTPGKSNADKAKANFVDVEAGYQFTLALTDDGKVWAWGAAGSGTLGSNVYERLPSADPLLVRHKDNSIFENVAAIEAGSYHNIAITKDGKVWTWGKNTNGALGDGTDGTLEPSKNYVAEVIGLNDASKTYKVTFDLKYGNQKKELQAEGDSKISQPEATEREGYTIEGWYKDEAYTVKWNFDTDIVTKDITLYAKWKEAASYTVTFNYNDGRDSTTVAVTEGKLIAEPQIPTREGYTFKGWYKEEALTNAWNFTADTVAANMTLYAKWTSAPKPEEPKIPAPCFMPGPIPQPGEDPGTTAVVVKNPEDKYKLMVKVASAIIPTPNEGDVAPTGAGVIDNYTAGADIPGTDPIVNRYIGIYEVNETTNKVVKFSLIILNTEDIKPSGGPAPGFDPNPVPEPGKDPGTTKFTDLIPGSGNKLMVKISSTLIETPNAGDEAPDDMDIDDYKEGEDIPGADHVNKRFIGIYEVDDKGKVVKFKLIILNADDIKPEGPGNPGDPKPSPGFDPNPVPKPGENPGTTKLTKLNPDGAYKVLIKVSPDIIETPNVGDEPPTGEGIIDPYTGGADIPNDELEDMDLFTNRYIGVYGVTEAVYGDVPKFEVVKFRLIILNHEDIKPKKEEKPTSAPGFNPKPVPEPGKEPGTTKLPGVSPKGSNRLIVKISSTVIATPNTGDVAPTKGDGVIDPYKEGSDIPGVDPVMKRFIGIYEVDSEGKVVSFRLIILNAGDIKPSDHLNEDWEDIHIIYSEGDDADHVRRAVYLPLKGKSGTTTVKWTSNNESLIKTSGRVTRPASTEGDTYVTLTATLKDIITGETKIKTFILKVLKIQSSDEDDVRDAAKDLTLAKAFIFADGDTWESITKQFMLLSSGKHGTSIAWTSSKTDIIRISEQGGDIAGEVNRPADRDENVIITAKISKGNISLTKTFLMIVKNKNTDKQDNSTRQPTARQAEISANADGTPSAASITILRTTLNDHTKIDTVILDPAKVEELTDNMNPSSDEEQRTVQVQIRQPASDKADEIAVEIPAAAISAMADRNAVLEIITDEGSVKLTAEALKATADSGTDLFFRIVPVKNTKEQNEAQNNLGIDIKVVQAAGGKEIKPLGIPRKIETNFTSFETTVVLPLAGIEIPTQNRAQFLAGLKVYIEHSDGATELVSGSIVYENGQPYGISFTINKFSRFQIVSFAAKDQGGSNGNSDNDNGKNTKEKSQDSSISKDADKKPEVEIYVNAKKQEKAAVIEKTKEGKTKVLIEDENITSILEKEAEGAVLTVKSAEETKDIETTLNAQTVKLMADKKQILEIKTPNLSYKLPAGAVNVEEIREALGRPQNLKDIKVVIGLSEIKTEAAKAINEGIQKSGAEMIGMPVEIRMNCTYGGKEVAVSSFKKYTQIMIKLPQGIDKNKITTGIYWDHNEKMSHEPTKVEIIEGYYYATVNSFYPGVYPLIYNPMEMKDVATHWSKKDVNDMASRIVVNGTGGDNYTPNKDITRAEFAAIVVKALGLRFDKDQKSFEDVKTDIWYHEAVSTAVEYKLILGYGNGKFGPDDKITREQGMTIISRAMEFIGMTVELNDAEVEKNLSHFADRDKTSGWAKNNIARCIKAGIVSGKEQQIIAPKDYITRAEVTAMVRRLLQNSDLIEK